MPTGYYDHVHQRKARIQRIGKKYGRLFVLEEVPERRDHGICYSCLCDCGNECIVRGSRLGKETNSCGCWQIEARFLKGTLAAERHHFREYDKSARRRGIDFYLTFDQFKKLIYENCYYCGELPSRHFPYYKIKKMESYKKAHGIDRMDNDMPYSIETCVTCCKKCNFMKAQLGHDDFIRQCFMVAKHVRYSRVKPLKQSVA